MSDSSPDDEWLDIQAEAQINQLMSQGKAREILEAYSEHNQSCSYVWGIVQHMAYDETNPGIDPKVRSFARNLLDDWTK